MIDNPMATDGRRALTEQQRRNERTAEVYTMLRSDLIDALMHDQAREVYAEVRRCPAYEIVADQFADSQTGDVSLVELLRIVARCAAGDLDHQTHLRASAWIAAAADRYAGWHAADVAAGMED